MRRRMAATAHASVIRGMARGFIGKKGLSGGGVKPAWVVREFKDRSKKKRISLQI